MQYFIELRRRLLRISCIFMILFALFFYFSSMIFQWMIGPLLYVLPSQTLITTRMMGPLFVPLRLAFDLALFCSALILLIELWFFMAPGLYRRERRLTLCCFFASLILFALGIAFSFYLILPFFFDLIVHAAPQHVRFMPDMADALDFMIRIFLLFGFCFQVPLLTFLCVHLNWVTRETLIKLRPYVIVFAFIIGMLLTPPDVLSQITLALPLWFLFEIGLLSTKIK